LLLNKTHSNHTRHEWARWDANISAADPDTLFEEYSSRGVTFHQPLLNDDDGLRGFEVADADGYILFFGRPNSVVITQKFLSTTCCHIICSTSE
jgi:hypothetical protein